MKACSKNLFYRLAIDNGLFEYRVKSPLLRSCFRFFRINTHITIPINAITRTRSRKALFGHFIEFTIAQASNRRGVLYKEVELRKFWLLQRAPLEIILPEMEVKRNTATETYQERTIPFASLNHKSIP